MMYLLRKLRFWSLCLALMFPVSTVAHEGHGGSEIGPYDLDTPRQVSPETAAHIGLLIGEVDFGTVEDVLALSGIVRPAPDRHWAISTRTAGATSSYASVA